MQQIVEILDKYHVDDFDDVLIRIVQTIAEQRELRKEEQDDVIKLLILILMERGRMLLLQTILINGWNTTTK